MAKSTPCDAELWTKTCNNDYRAFTVLFNRYWLVLYKTANLYVKDIEVCEEIVLDLFLTLWNRRNYIVIDNLPNYLKASVRYQVYARLKKTKKPAILYVDSYTEDAGSWQENEGQEKLIYGELENDMNICLEQLPRRCSEIFSLSRIQYFSNEEIAEQLGISKRSVENQLTLALKHLRIHFKVIGVFLVSYCGFFKL